MSAPAGRPVVGTVGRPRVVVRRIRAGDATAYGEAVRRSAARIAEWNPVDPDDFPRLLAANEAGNLVTLFVVDRMSGALAGRVNVNNITRGRARSAALGYDAYDPFVGTGRMTEGLGLAVDLCFAPPAQGGLGLHRLEINVQPDNARSIALVHRLGFRYEGFSPRFLFIGGAWRDHERFAITAEEWPTSTHG
jgi:[ribosomal protein S5]-alanine N-acetyltransferase